MGLIDVLTQYDTKKKAAHAARAVKHGVSHQFPLKGSVQMGFFCQLKSDFHVLFTYVLYRQELKSQQFIPNSTPNVSGSSSQRSLPSSRIGVWNMMSFTVQ